VGLLALLALAGVIGAVAIATAPSTTRVTLRNVVENDAEKSAAALKQLVEENTK
jgi:hypothetical protein